MRRRGRRFVFPSSLLENCFLPRVVCNSSSCWRRTRPLFGSVPSHHPATRDVTFHWYQALALPTTATSTTVESKSPPPDPHGVAPSVVYQVAPSSAHGVETRCTATGICCTKSEV